MKKQMVIVVSEGETGAGGVVRTIIVPDTKRVRKAAEDMAADGNQYVNFIEPDYAKGVADVRAIFNEMNPPDTSDADDDTDPASGVTA